MGLHQVNIGTERGIAYQVNIGTERGIVSLSASRRHQCATYLWHHIGTLTTATETTLVNQSLPADKNPDLHCSIQTGAHSDHWFRNGLKRSETTS